MTIEEKQQFAIGEAKDYLKELNESIIRTRDKCWQLLAFIIAICSFLIQATMFSDKVVSLETKLLTITTILFSAVAAFNLRKSILPATSFRLNGDTAKNLLLFINEPLVNMYEESLYNYDNSINKNKEVLDEIKTGYGFALNTMLLLIVLAAFFAVWFMFCKGAN